MADRKAKKRETQPRERAYVARHRARGAQVWICLGKLLRMFVYQNDWKVLPMSALIAGLVGMVIRKRFCLNMEGTAMGAFALVCVCIWNGAFNSIQVICRERDVVKREHRSGMYVFSYVFAHMLYQALICLLQTGITLYVTILIGVQYPVRGLIIPYFPAELAVSMFLITYASDMLSLWVSSLSRTTTAAMTVMPFVLIFQLVFSGGMLQLPEWTKALTRFTVSNPGLKVIAAQADTNNRPFVTITNMIDKMRDDEVPVTVTLGQILDVLSQEDNPAIADLRSERLRADLTVGDVLRVLQADAEAAPADTAEGASLREALALLEASGGSAAYESIPITVDMTVGELVDRLNTNPVVREHRGATYSATPTVGDLLAIAGEDKVRADLEERSAKASYRPEYAYTEENVIGYWFHLLLFAVVFSFLSAVTLSFIDKDRR